VLKRSAERAAAGGDAGRNAGPIDIRLDRQQASVNGVPLDLTNMELRILAALVDRSGAVVTRQHLSRYAVGRELLPEDRTLDTHVSNLRRKIAAAGESGCTIHTAGESGCTIHTVRGSGYRLTVN